MEHVDCLQHLCKVLTSNEGSWGARVKSYLDRIDTDIVMILLDDFLLEEPVDEQRLNQYIHQMQSDTSIANIALADIYDDKNKNFGADFLTIRPKKGWYLLNLQAGLWRRDVLYELLKDEENPWQTEIYGSIRARAYSDYKFLCLKDDQYMPYKYNRGWLIVRGKWNRDEIERLQLQPYWEYLFDGKDIVRFGYKIPQPHLFNRIVTRLKITGRQLLSNFRIYI